MHADEWQFFGHFELQTPNHKTLNSPKDSLHRTGTNNNYSFENVDGGSGQYCGTAWEYLGSPGSYSQIGYVCFDA
jgi:hypothetical protein